MRNEASFSRPALPLLSRPRLLRGSAIHSSSEGELHPFPAFVRVLPEIPPPAAAGRWSSPGDERAGTEEGRLPHPPTRSPDLPPRDPAAQGSRRRLGESGADLPCPALPVTGTGKGHTESSAQAGTCPRSLGWAAEERGAALGMEKGRGSSPIPGEEGPTAGRVL